MLFFKGGCSIDEIGDMDFPLAHLLVGKHFEHQKLMFDTIASFLGGSSKSGGQESSGPTNFEGIPPDLKGESEVKIAPVQDNPYPEGMMVME